MTADLQIDLPRLLETRLLIQANSGGGKSWCLRWLLEKTAGQVMQIVIDPEGEFATLRERFDYVICSQHGGDALAHPKTAKLLARRLMELNVSAILDIYDLKAHERQRFVRLFLESLVNLPKKLWRPVLVVLDEAHIYAPEKGKAESAAAVIDVATRGRKRGMCLVAATQRLAKFHKDAAAELLNKLIGRTGLDIDVRRAGEELGMTHKEALALRDLEPGQFHAFGPAISTHVKRVTVGAVQTTHPKVGHRLMADPPAPSAKVAKMLEALKDLPAESEEAERTAADLRREIANLKRQLTLANRQQPKPETKTVEKVVERVPSEFVAIVADLSKDLTRADDANSDAIHKVNLLKQLNNSDHAVVTVPSKRSPVARQRPVRRAPAAPERPQSDVDVTRPQQNVLDSIAWLESFGVIDPAKPSVAAIAGVSPKSGAFANNLGALRTRGLIDYPTPGCTKLTEEGWQAASPPEQPPSLDALHDRWLDVVTNPQAKILRVAISAYPGSVSKYDLALEIGVSPTSGAFANNLGRLRTIGAIDYPQQGQVRAEDILFPSLEQ